MSMTILKPGLMSSVQDLGRWGFQQNGVPVSGAMDKISAALANMICGNDENEAVLEMTLHGTNILLNEATVCSLVGGGCKAFVEDVELPFNRLLHIPAFSVITTQAVKTGCRTYFSVAGGLDVQKTMGSASTYAPSGIGGIEGRNLIAGDVLHFKKREHSNHASSLKSLGNNIYVSHWEIPDLITFDKEPRVIHVVRGPEYDLFESSSLEKLLNTIFTISSQSNRMGYRLEGEKLLLKEKHEMVSTPVASGIIQVTHDGMPIILMADAQTTGGYPRVARICSTDMSLLAQSRPGIKLKFTEISEEECRNRYNDLSRRMSKLKIGMTHS